MFGMVVINRPTLDFELAADWDFKPLMGGPRSAAKSSLSAANACLFSG
jgi:hypothetical protein